MDKEQAMTHLKRAQRAGVPLAACMQADLLSAALDAPRLVLSLLALLVNKYKY
jgi:hypothetical protein